MTAAGRRVIDLLENQWTTDVTHRGGTFSMRGYHGDYQVHVRYQGNERLDLQQNFTLGQAQQTVTINI